MAVSPILEIPEVAPTQTDKTTTLNDMIVAIEAAANDQLTIDFSTANVTLSFAQFSRFNAFLGINIGVDRTLTVPLLTPTGNLPAKRVFLVRNTSVSHTLTVGGATGGTVVLAAGTASMIQSDGSNCIGYAVGGAGPTGPTGPAGGAVSINFAFDSSTGNSDPGSGKLRLNNATQNLATAIYLDVLDTAYGTDWTAVLDTLDASSSTVKGQLRLFTVADPSHWIEFDLTSRTTHTGYRELAVTVVGYSSASPFTATDVINLVFSRTGDTGIPVLTTVNDWVAAQRTTPVTLVDGPTITPDFSVGNNFIVTLGGNRTLANPTSMGTGLQQAGQIVVIQDGAGSRTLTLDTFWKTQGGLGIQLSTAPGAVDIISYFQWDDTHIAASTGTNWS
jgi:hypothetical protein